MAKRSGDSGNSEWVKVNEETQTVPLVLLREVKLHISGPVTKKMYFFDGAGSVVFVDEADVDAMLKIRKGHSCCGNELDHPQFQLAV